ncbi:MAG: N-6 DNA methylase [Bacteroidales bacterium]|nr:N-6 DNA methylase [Bacteroidales bacterium]
MTNKEFKKLKDDLWLAANKLRADSDLKSNDYSPPVLGIIFLKFADIKYSQYEKEIKAEFEKNKGNRLKAPIEKIAIEKCGLYIPDTARYHYLKDLPEGDQDNPIDKAVIQAMKDIEKHVVSLKDTLPKDEYYEITRKGQSLLKQLLKLFSTIPDDSNGDLLGKIYEFFLGKFGLDEAQKGGEFFTPTSVVNLMVEYIEPYHGKIFDPACGSGGMFVQSANFIRRHHLQKGAVSPIYVYGQEKTLQTVNLGKMNLAINGLRGEIKQGDSYAEDLYDSFGKFDFVMANPPFNVKEVNEDTVKKDKRFTEYGLPKSKSKKKSAGVVNIPNGNYLWISLFATSLNETGKAALVMSNSASDAGHSEYDIRQTLVRKGLISGMLTLPSNMFSTVTLPATLWFFDKSNEIADFETGKDKIQILFVYSRNVFHQVDRAHREFTDEQLQNLAAINYLRKGNRKFFIELVHSHYENAFVRLPILKELLQESTKSIQEQYEAFSKWAATTKPNKEQKELLDKEQFFEKLKTFTVSDTKKVIEDIDKALADFEKYTKNYDAEKPKEINSAQHILLQDNETLLQDYLVVKKALEKSFRKYENLFKLAESKLKSKDDKKWKALAKPKEIRLLLDKLNEYSNLTKSNNYEYEEKSPVYFLKMAEWLQQRFPLAKYEDVTGLCKLANIADIEEQDYSLNPGRYVGVVIEEDGMTEEEFETEIKSLNTELTSLNGKASELERTINQNLLNLFENE